MNNLTSVSAVQSEQSVMPNLVHRMSNEDINSIRNDFIQHPAQYPLEIKRIRRWPWSAKANVFSKASLGIKIRTDAYLEAGSEICISIPLRGEAQSFRGDVVFVRELSDGYEIGVWMQNQQDEARIRIVEKICHTECNLKLSAVPSAVDISSARARKHSWLNGHRPLLGH